MSRFIVVLAGLFAMFPFYAAIAAENGRFALNEKWKQQQACQAEQADQLKALEAEAQRSVCGLADKAAPSMGLSRTGRKGAPTFTLPSHPSRQQP